MNLFGKKKREAAITLSVFTKDDKCLFTTRLKCIYSRVDLDVVVECMEQMKAPAKVMASGKGNFALIKFNGTPVASIPGNDLGVDQFLAAGDMITLNEIVARYPHSAIYGEN